jgi:hypothetical protein
MTRYFFDVNAGAYVQYDYTGRLLGSIIEAQGLAEMMALDRACTEVDQSRVTEIEVRDSYGNRLISFSIPFKDMVCA